MYVIFCSLMLLIVIVWFYWLLLESISLPSTTKTHNQTFLSIFWNCMMKIAIVIDFIKCSVCLFNFYFFATIFITLCLSLNGLIIQYITTVTFKYLIKFMNAHDINRYDKRRVLSILFMILFTSLDSSWVSVALDIMHTSTPSFLPCLVLTRHTQ